MEETNGKSSESEENLEDLLQKVRELEEEKKRIHNEFNLQRAKMKELFLQKEGEFSLKEQENSHLNEIIDKLKREVDEAKSQAVATGLALESDIEIEKRKAEAEIATLQKLVHETIEESSSSKTVHYNEIERLQLIIQELQSELKKQTHNSPHHTPQEHSLVPTNVLNVLTKGIAKKLGGESFSSQDSLDDSLRKYDDPELLRSLVEPLEDQITALKEKLRATDEQLQKCKECGHNEGSNSSFESSTTSNSQNEKNAVCDMCRNYEAQLVNEQKKNNELSARATNAEKAVERHKEELMKEIGFRKDMEEKWNEKKEELKHQVASLTRSTECAEQDLKELRQTFLQSCSDFRSTLKKLTKDREMIYEEIKKLQLENDNLVGKYTMHSQELQSQAIDLPNTVEELHELILKNNQDLIIAKIGKEHAEANEKTLQSSVQLLKNQIDKEQHEKESLEKELLQEIKSLREQKSQIEKEMKRSKSNQDKMNELQDRINELTLSKEQLVQSNNELRSRISSLQLDLDNSEQVQKDFVLLSQSLQVQLEKIRASDAQVRWQHEEDVDSCPSCHSNFTNTKKKQHCRHCGQIFCQQCVGRIVNSGPNMRASKVCDVCHTLLVQSSAPYFSEAPPPT